MGAWLESRKLAGKHYDNHRDPAPLLGALESFSAGVPAATAPWLRVERLAAEAGLRLHPLFFKSAYHLGCSALAGQGWLLHTCMRRKDQRALPLFLSRVEAAWPLSGSAVGFGSLCPMSHSAGKMLLHMSPL